MDLMAVVAVSTVETVDALLQALSFPAWRELCTPMSPDLVRCAVHERLPSGGLDSARDQPELRLMATEGRSASPLDGPREVDIKALHCGDLTKGCDFVATGATEEEVMNKAAEHARKIAERSTRIL
jgi:predicted small metal-binding protein